ncbi:hypothetical protein PVK06_020641 [Gossypium arboreum]|uniref:Aminotransferase-like plant mobile domain-containing protein n=1 Tax=Gossypium arboreum TaxID=29729 RepID=A0ABR0PNE2_GOSAR|nr:hypothetical protein PVK06_020641 [Gossypium arboreum]
MVPPEDTYHVLRTRGNGPIYWPDEWIMPYLDVARFGSVALIHVFKLRANLIYTLVERWHPKTLTFHLSCGKCTITLENVALQLRLSMDGDVVTGLNLVVEPIVLCYDFLGCSPGDAGAKFTNLKFSWLKENFKRLSSNAIERGKMCAAQAYILQLIGRAYVKRQ